MIPIIGEILGLAGKFIPDQTKLAELEAELSSKMEDTLKQAVDADKEIRLAEMAKGGIASVWRPIAALTLTMIVVFHQLVIPLMGFYSYFANEDRLWQFVESTEPLPTYFWIAYIAFINVYAAGRSFEKGRIPLLRMLGGK
jgi:hypothetical protein